MYKNLLNILQKSRSTGQGAALPTVKSRGQFHQPQTMKPANVDPHSTAPKESKDKKDPANKPLNTGASPYPEMPSGRASEKQLKSDKELLQHSKATSSEAKLTSISSAGELNEINQSSDESFAYDRRVVKARQKILKALKGVSDLENEVNAFVGLRTDKSYLRLEHELTNRILCLDAVSAAGAAAEEEVRAERKEAIKRLQQTLDILELKGMAGGIVDEDGGVVDEVDRKGSVKADDIGKEKVLMAESDDNYDMHTAESDI